jgi:hypothetical protein
MELVCESEIIACIYLKNYFSLHGDVQSRDGSIHLADNKLTVWMEYTADVCIQFLRVVVARVSACFDSGVKGAGHWLRVNINFLDVDLAGKFAQYCNLKKSLKKKS